MRALLLAVGLTLSLGAGAPAEERARTLGEIRAELEALRAEMTRLRAELVATGAAAAGFEAVSVLDRVQAMDEALRRLTGRTEELEFRINRIVEDGTRRLNDLEFRLVELEGGDVSAVGEAPPLGGGAPGPAPSAAPGASDGPLMALGEEAAFAAAEDIFARGDWARAVEALGDFVEAYPVGPLTPRAHLLRAEAQEALGETAPAARSLLAAFEADPEGPEAPRALLGLGRALGALGQAEEACIMLDELGLRFPTTAAAGDAVAVRRELGCP